MSSEEQQDAEINALKRRVQKLDGRTAQSDHVASFVTSSVLTVEEVDASPSVASVVKIKVANRNLTDEGSGVVRVAGNIFDQIFVGDESAEYVADPTVTGKPFQLAKDDALFAQYVSNQFNALEFFIHNGTMAAPTVSADGDYIAYFGFWGYDGDQHVLAGEYSIILDGTPADNDIPIMHIWLVDNDSLTALRLRNSGIAEFGGHLELRSDADGSDGLAHEARFFEDAANGVNYVGFKAPASLAADKIWVLPAADGAVGAAFRTDGAGNLSLVKHAGSGTIASGSTSVVVAHGCASTPTAADITITPTNNPTNDPGNWWVDTIGGTNMTVNVRNNPGLGGFTFGWRVDLP